MAEAREDYLFSAKVAEQAERYPDMVAEMKKVAEAAGEQELTTEERNMLSVAYKNMVGTRRASWRILQSMEASEATKGNEKRVELIRKYRHAVEKELDDVCDEILGLLDGHLVPSATNSESSVFYLKMKADYLRYLSEYKTDTDRKAAAEKTLMAYAGAQDKATTDLPPTSPIRLGLALNFSVFYYEVMNQPEKACSLAKQAFDEAISPLDTLGEESYKDSALILQLLRDNLTLWTSEMQDLSKEASGGTAAGVGEEGGDGDKETNKD